jgi:hypothetical protein
LKDSFHNFQPFHPSFNLFSIEMSEHADKKIRKEDGSSSAVIDSLKDKIEDFRESIKPSEFQGSEFAVFSKNVFDKMIEFYGEVYPAY